MGRVECSPGLEPTVEEQWAVVGEPMEIQLAGCVVDLTKRAVHRGGTTIRLTTRESDLLSFLADSPETPFTDYHLLEKVWGYRSAVISRAVDQLLYRLRKKIEIDPSHPDHLVKVYGEGIKFVPLAGASMPVVHIENQPSLPTWHGNFHGRQTSLEYLRNYAHGGQPIAVTGLSGIGKTRLVAHWLSEEEGVRLFVSPEDLTDPGRLVMSMAAQLDAPPSTSLDTMLERLESAKLVLDGVPANTAEIRELVATISRCAHLTVVYTALRPLEIPGERVWVVPELSPEVSATMLAELASTAAPKQGTSAESSAFSALVECLGGHPLAIELCAPRCRALGVREVERHWRSQIDTATGKTMAHAVARSWELLDASTQTALRRFCVFTHGTDVPGAEALFAEFGGITVLEELVAAGVVAISPRAAIFDSMWLHISQPVLRFVRAISTDADAQQARSRLADRLACLAHRLGENITVDRTIIAAYQSAILDVLEGELSNEQRVTLTFLSAVSTLSEPLSRRHESHKRLDGVRSLLTEEDQGTFTSLRIFTASSLSMGSCLEDAQALLQSQTLPPGEQFSLTLVVDHALTRLGRPQEGLALLRETIAQSDGDQVPDYPRMRLWAQYAWRCTNHAEPEELFRAASTAVELATRVDDPTKVCRAWYMMGIANGENGRNQAAIDAYEHAISVGIPGHQQTRSAQANLGYHLCMIGRESEGLPLLRQITDDNIDWDQKVKASRQLCLIPFVEPKEARARLGEVDQMMRREVMGSLKAVVAAEWAIVEAQTNVAQAQAHLERAIALAHEDQIPPGSSMGRRIEAAKQRVAAARQHLEN